MKHLTKTQVLDYRGRVLKDAEKHGVSRASRMYGVTRKTIYNWRKEICPQKTGPRSAVFWQTDEELEILIIQIRLATGYGPKRIKDELADFDIIVGEKAIRGVIEDAELVKKQRKPRKKVNQRFHTSHPGYRIQIDTKAVPVPAGDDKRSCRHQQFTAIDIASRIRYLEIMDGLSNTNSLLFVKRALQFYEDIGIQAICVQTDNHSTFTNLYAGGNKKEDRELRRVHPLTLYLTSRGLEHKLSRPGMPEQNGFVERSHRTDEEEFYATTRVTTLSLQALQNKMKQWQDEYNNLRRHSSCNNLPPMDYFNTYWRESLSP